ncbi:hypothetical protein FHW83_001729 [Duganella sp. SG902]|uniref:hypothetical protein n=1 Tax=Duganella sp. SG902 TaxID=2587016 RepID=UPI00159D244E|nr:hypothetical protein [Duganella sp. SG902]NVM75942.1 hypothetical protein [Duganella sp. SG902]
MDSVSESFANNKKNRFSRREWLFLICILLMVEYWIFHVSIEFADSQSVLNYISFAGTISSIILAVVAIIYSFVQGDSQQAMSGILARELENLKDVAGDLSEYSSEFKTHLVRVDTITDKIEALDRGILASQGQLSSIQGVVTKMSEAQATMGLGIKSSIVNVPAAPAGQRTDNEMLRIILRRSTYEADIISYALNAYSGIDENKRPSYFIFISNIVASAMLEASKQKAPSVTSNLNGYIDSVHQICMVLRAADFIILENDKGMSKSFSLSRSLLESLPVFATEVRASDNPYVKASIAAIDESVAKI